jgi:oligoendopeptidase F
MNYKEAFGSVATLAHELGHAYHNLCLAERTAVQSQTPMTLAETASIFCETVIKRRALRSATGGERLAILEASLQGACQVVVDITSRYLFEQAVYERRGERELSGREFCSLMTDAQQATYGDGLSSYHPYMWAVKPHYYAWRPFYNFPYMFGLLFSLGLYAVYEAEPLGFHARYDELLSSTGMADAATLAERFGIDTRSKSFWAASLKVLEQDVEMFVAEGA